MAAVVWATLMAGPAGWTQTADEVTVSSDAESRETTYTAASAGCRIRWIVSSLEINRGVVRHRADCSLPLPEQVSLIARVMSRVLGDFAGAGAPWTLFWGRLYPDARQDYLLAMRLALAAKRSELWDAARGRTRAGNVNDLIRKLSNDTPIHPELREMFSRSGLDLQVAAVEKVLVSEAGQLPFFERFPKGEIQATDKLPYDCMMWFAVRRRR